MQKRVFSHMLAGTAQISQSDQDLGCLQTETLATMECFSGRQMQEWDFAHEQDNVSLHILHVLKGTFSLDTAQMINI